MRTQTIRKWVLSCGPERHHAAYADLPGGHWPRLTQPDALARIILDAADKAVRAAS